MRSTDSKRRDERLQRFFERRLAPAAERLRARGVRFFALGPDASDESWYQSAASGQPEFVELGGEEFEAAFRALWESQELPELLELAAELMELARELRQDPQQSSKVSPYVYVLY